VKKNTDGFLSKTIKEKDDQAVQLADKSDKLSHAEGHREGVEEKKRVVEKSRTKES
jgi:hypothetical protein